MKKLILTVTLVITTITFLFAQTPPARTYYNNRVVKERWFENANGQKHGKYIRYDENGSMYFYANFSNDELNGLVKYSNGEYENYKMGVLHGPFYRCSLFGCKKGNYVNGSREGYWIEFDEKGNYVNDKKNGYWIEDNGKSKGNYVNGERNGNWITLESKYNESESGTVTGNYIKGVKIGKWTNLYHEYFVENGYTGDNDFSYKEGYSTIFDNNGKIIDILNPSGISVRKIKKDEQERKENEKKRLAQEKERADREEQEKKQVEFEKRQKAQIKLSDIRIDFQNNIIDTKRTQLYQEYYTDEVTQMYNEIETKKESNFKINFNYNSLIPSFYGEMHIRNYINALTDFNNKNPQSKIETIYVITHVRVGQTYVPNEQNKELTELSYNRAVFLTRMIYQMNPNIKVIALPTLNEIKNEPGCIIQFDRNNEIVEKAINIAPYIINKFGDISSNTNYIVDAHIESAERDIRQFVEREVDVTTQSVDNNYRRIPVEYKYIYDNKYPNEIIANCLAPMSKNGLKAMTNILKIIDKAAKKLGYDDDSIKYKFNIKSFSFKERLDSESY